MRLLTVVLFGAAIAPVGVAVPVVLAQPAGPATDKVDTSPADTAKTDTPPSPPDTAPLPSAAPESAPPQQALPQPAPPQQTPSQQTQPQQAPAPEQAPEPADVSKSGGTVETVGSGQAISILGRKVVGPDGKTILGSVIDMLVDAEGKPRAAIIDFGGFLGVGSRHVAIDWDILKFHLDQGDTPVQLDLDPAQIKAAPEYKEVDANAKVVEPDLVSPTPLPVLPALSEQPILTQLPPAVTRPAKNAGQ